MHRASDFTALRAFPVLAIPIGISPAAGAEQVTVVPKGAYAEIDTHVATETMRVLQEGNRKEKAKAMLVRHKISFQKSEDTFAIDDCVL